MFIKASERKSKYDFTIVGAGPAGLALAQELDRLSSGDVSILIIESGSLEAESSALDLSVYSAEGDLESEYFAPHNQRMVGGTSSVWAGFCTVMEERAFLNGEWPFAYRELYQHYPRAAEFLEISTQSHILPETSFGQSSLIYKPYFHSAPKRFNDAKTRFWLSQSPSIHLLLEHTVTDVKVHEGRTSGLELAHNREPALTLDVDVTTLVIACGGIQNARLLSLSDETAGSVALGRYFCEHPHIYNAFELTIDAEKFHQTVASIPDDVTPALALSSQYLQASGLVSATLSLSEYTEHQQNLLGQRRTVLRAKATVRAEMLPLAENQVSLSRTQADLLNQPIAAIDFKFDRAGLNQSIDAFSEQLLRSGLGRLRSNPLQTAITGGGHMMGTTRMGIDPQTSVTNADGRLHAVANTYVAGSSLFPASGAANPTFTIVALAMRLANHLHLEIRGVS